MEGDLGLHILSYVHDEDMLSVACTNKDVGDKVHETCNTEERHMCSSARRVQICMNLLRAQSGELYGQGQIEMMEPGQYGDIEVADDRYKIGLQVRIINDPDYVGNRKMEGYSGTVV